MATEAKHFAQRYIDAINDHDYDRLATLIADPIEYHAMSGNAILTTPADVVELYRQGGQRFPDGKISVALAFGDHEWAALRVQLTYTEHGETRSATTAVFHRWINGQLAYYRGYPETGAEQVTDLTRQYTETRDPSRRTTPPDA